MYCTKRTLARRQRLEALLRRASQCAAETGTLFLFHDLIGAQ